MAPDKSQEEKIDKYLGSLKRGGKLMFIVGIIYSFFYILMYIGSRYFEGFFFMAILPFLIYLIYFIIFTYTGKVISKNYGQSTDILLWILGGLLCLILIFTGGENVGVLQLILIIIILLEFWLFYRYKKQSSDINSNGWKAFFSKNITINIGIILIILLGSLYMIGRYQVNNMNYSLSTQQTAPSLIIIPEFNEDYDLKNLSLNYIFNWGIENKVNVGLFYDPETKEYTIVDDIQLKNRKWWQPLNRFFTISDPDVEITMRKGIEVLQMNNYTIDYKNSNNYKIFIQYIDSHK